MPKYIAAGFSVDAEKLLKDFAGETSFHFSAFIPIWKKHNFAAIYLGRDKTQILPFTNEIFQITLGFLQNCSVRYQIGVIYLLYALYRHQIAAPLMLIRITLRQFEIFKKIQFVAMTNHFNTLQYVTDYLYKHTFDFVAHSSLYGPVSPKIRVDYDKPLDISAVGCQEAKLELTEFHDSRILEDLRDLNVEYTNLKKKLCIQGVHIKVHDYDNYIKQLDCLVNDEPMKGTKSEFCIGSNRAKLKTSSFSNKALFRQLNSDGEINHSMVEKTQPVKKFLKKKRLPMAKRKIGRPRKKDLEEFLHESDSMDENSASDSELPVLTEKRGPKRTTVLDDFKILPTKIPAVTFTKKESHYTLTPSESEESNYQEEDVKTDDVSNYEEQV